MNRLSAWLGWSLLALSLALFGIGIAFTALTPVGPGERRFILWPVDPTNLGLLTYVAVGALIASQRPRNAIGWIFCAFGLVSEIHGCGQAYAAYLAWAAPAVVPVPSPLLVLAVNMWSVSFALAPAVLLYFPNGQLLSRRWQAVVWLVALIIGAGYASSGTQFRAGTSLVQFPSLLNLLGFNNDSSLASGLFVFSSSGYLLIYGLGAIAILLRFRRARGDERQQLKWFAYAALLFVAVVVVTSMFFEALQPLDPGALYPLDLFFGVPYALAAAAIPVAAGIAILKYRLYDIDILIRRTLVYGVLTGLLALVYLGVVVALQALFTLLTGAQRSELVTVISTLVIAALFVPLRKRLQAAIDRRFYRRGYDAARTLAAFGASLRDEVNLDELSARLISVVDDTMQPEQVSLWIKTHNSRRPTPGC
jgi:hypothetical protein